MIVSRSHKGWTYEQLLMRLSLLEGVLSIADKVPSCRLPDLLYAAQFGRNADLVRELGRYLAIRDALYDVPEKDRQSAEEAARSEIVSHLKNELYPEPAGGER